MKTYFIKDDETKTAEDYIENYDIYNNIDLDGSIDIAEFNSAIDGNQYYDVLKQLEDISNDYSDADEYRNWFDASGSIADDITNIINDAKKDGNIKAVAEIKKIMNRQGFVSGLSEVSKDVSEAINALTKYKSGLDKAIQKFKSLGITK